ncbi:MAG TPA: hypothetical protein PKN44_06760 [Bacteroidales bacterium]|nr:hypothetical protein [Bacteroidales bacterium]
MRLNKEKFPIIYASMSKEDRATLDKIMDQSDESFSEELKKARQTRMKNLSQLSRILKARRKAIEKLNLIRQSEEQTK